MGGSVPYYSSFLGFPERARKREFDMLIDPRYVAVCTWEDDHEATYTGRHQSRWTLRVAITEYA